MSTKWQLGVLVALMSVTSMALASAPIKVTAVVAEGRVLTSFSAASAFADEAREIVSSGLPLTFTYTVELRRPALLFDRTLSSATVAASVKLDNLTRVYQVSKLQDGRVIWSDRTDHEPRMREWMTSFEKVPLDVKEPLEVNADYYVRVRLHASAHSSFSLWPFGRDDGSGRAEFTFIR